MHRTHPLSTNLHRNGRFQEQNMALPHSMTPLTQYIFAILPFCHNVMHGLMLWSVNNSRKRRSLTVKVHCSENCRKLLVIGIWWYLVALGIPDICQPRHPRRQCKNFKVRGILVCNFTYSVYFCTQCEILHTVCNFTHSVIIYSVYKFTHSV